MLGSWPRSERQRREDHRQPVGVMSRLDTAHGCSSTQAAAQGPPDRAREAPGSHTRPEARQDRAAAQTAAEAARRGRGRPLAAITGPGGPWNLGWNPGSAPGHQGRARPSPAPRSGHRPQEAGQLAAI